MWLQALALFAIPMTRGVGPWSAALVLLGLGTALVYPTLLGAVSDASRPAWRASAVGVYRLWRDSGYAVGALIAGVLADRFDAGVAIGAVGGLTFVSGAVVAALMKETLNHSGGNHGSSDRQYGTGLRGGDHGRKDPLP
jgi:MFS family permease